MTDPLPSDEATRVASSGDEPTLTAESCIEPSDEAVEAAWREAHEASRDYIAQPTVRAALTAAYRIDMPRREVRAATLREVEPLRERLATMNECVRIYLGMRDRGTPARPGWLEEEVAASDALLAAHFNQEAEPKRSRNHAPWCSVEHKGPCDFNQETE